MKYKQQLFNAIKKIDPVTPSHSIFYTKFYLSRNLVNCYNCPKLTKKLFRPLMNVLSDNIYHQLVTYEIQTTT